MSNVLSGNIHIGGKAALTEEDVVRRTLLDLLTSITSTSDDKSHAEPQEEKNSRRESCMYGDILGSADARPRPNRIAVVERLSSMTVSVCWSDARLGRQADEVWRLGRARSESFCLLTGRPIEDGEWVFRPRIRRGYREADGSRAILACAIDEPAQHDSELQTR
jgi:hypothetical protein